MNKETHHSPPQISSEVQAVLERAIMEAHSATGGTVQPMHLLGGLLEESSLCERILHDLNVPMQPLRAEIANWLATSPQEKAATGASDEENSHAELAKVPRMSRHAQNIMVTAQKDASYQNELTLFPKHILAALAGEDTYFRTYLAKYGVHKKDIIEMAENFKTSGVEATMKKEQFLQKYTNDLTQLAREEKLEPIIGKLEETRRLMEILSRKMKSNPVLVGHAGVGKTAIVEGLARRVAHDDVPFSLKNTTILALDLGSLLAGSQFRGQFEERLKKVIAYVEKSQGKLILFIDEIHMLMGAGKIDGALDAANLLKPALGRGAIRIIGATTLAEYKKYIEKDPAFERRMQSVYVEESTHGETLSILRGIRERYELHHNVEITEAAMEAAVALSERYINDRYLPDKAIDLIDEAAAKVKVDLESMPEDIDTLQRDVERLTIELKGLNKDKGANQTKISTLQAKHNHMTEHLATLKKRWQRSKQHYDDYNNLKKELDELKHRETRLSRAGKLDQVAEIRYSTRPHLEEKLRNLEDARHVAARLVRKQATSTSAEKEALPPLHNVVGRSEIEHVISRWTGIPVAELNRNEKNHLLQLEKTLAQRIVNQDHALTAIANAIKRNRLGLTSGTKPIGSFLFLGPSGVGKTFTAECLAQYLFHDKKRLIRLDMSEYMESHAVAKIIGAPPGYVGFDSGHTVCDQLLEHPYSVVLFDEIEKAHSETLNLLLQILDKGTLVTSAGKRVDFTHTLIILTSNLLSQLPAQRPPSPQTAITAINGEAAKTESLQEVVNKFNGAANTAAEASSPQAKRKLRDHLRRYLKPELVGRIDEVIKFHPLGIVHGARIFENMLRDFNAQLVKERKLVLLVKDSVKDLVYSEGFEETSGARGLEHAFNERIVSPLAHYLLTQANLPTDTLSVDLGSDGNIQFSPAGEMQSLATTNITKPPSPTVMTIEAAGN